MAQTSSSSQPKDVSYYAYHFEFSQDERILMAIVIDDCVDHQYKNDEQLGEPVFVLRLEKAYEDEYEAKRAQTRLQYRCFGTHSYEEAVAKANELLDEGFRLGGI
jgi:hypothetical protein